MKTIRAITRAYAVDPYVAAFLDAVAVDITKGTHPLAAFVRQSRAAEDMGRSLTPKVSALDTLRTRVKKVSTVQKAKTVEPKAPATQTFKSPQATATVHRTVAKKKRVKRKRAKKVAKRATNGSGKKMGSKKATVGLPVTSRKGPPPPLM